LHTAAGDGVRERAEPAGVAAREYGIAGAVAVGVVGVLGARSRTTTRVRPAAELARSAEAWTAGATCK